MIEYILCYATAFMLGVVTGISMAIFAVRWVVTRRK